MPGPVPPPGDPKLDMVTALSPFMDGDVLLPVWWSTREQACQSMGLDPFPYFTRERFRYHFLLSPRVGGLPSRFSRFAFHVRVGWRLHRQRSYDCIVVYGYSLTAGAGAVLKLLTGAKLVFMVPSEPGKSYLMDRSRPALVNRLFFLLSTMALHVTALFADRASVLYAEQLSAFPLLRNYPVAVDRPFVPVSAVRRRPIGEKYIVMVGFPWYLKGVDILIRAFRSIESEFPDVTLKIQGHIPDPASLDMLIGGSKRIELLKPQPYMETLDLIAGALILVLPSRTEGMGRVLIEAMAAGRPCIGAKVGGIPACIQEGETGLLVQPGNPDDLADKLRLLLSDGAYRERLGTQAYAYAHSAFSEETFGERFRQSVLSTIDH